LGGRNYFYINEKGKQMKVLKILFIILVLIIAVIIVIGLFLPSEITVERTLTINAPPLQIYPQINNLHNWSKWTVWAQMDTNMTNIYEGLEAGEGSIYKWSGNEDVGSGIITITKSDSNEGIWYDMSMEEGQFQSKGYITYEPEEDQTSVTWGYHADAGGNIIFKYVMVFFKPYIKHDFDKGLQGLKNLVESDSTMHQVEADSINEGY
jgi:hypothetical protein